MSGNTFAQSSLKPCHSFGFFYNCFVAYITDTGDQYIGEWGEWNRTAQSKEVIFTSASGIRLVEKFNFSGTASFSGGHKFVGEFKDGKPNGKGTLFDSDGSLINQGFWFDGRFSRSVFQDPTYNGQGVYSKDGYKYVGEWMNGRYGGQGTLSLDRRGKYVGEFKDNKFNGQGTLYSPDGLVVATGIWANGKLIRSESVKRSSPNEISASNCKQPEYPSMSKRLEEEGTVEVIFVVEPDGKVKAAAVRESSGFFRLDVTVIRWLSQCQFKPAIIGGTAQQSWVSMKFSFKLETTGK